MVWTAMGLLFVPAVLFKLFTRHGRHQIWWTCGTAAPATSIAAGAILGNEHQVGEFLGAPNVAILLAGLFSVAGCACCLIFWYAVRTESLNPAIMRRHAGVAGLVGLAMVGLWLLAPVHTYAYTSFRAIPVSWQLVVYALLFELYFIASQVYAVVTAYRLLKSPQDHDPGLRNPAIRFAVALNLPGAALAIFGQAFYLIRLRFQTSAPATAAGLVAVADLVTLGSMAIYAVGGLIALAGPRLAAEFRNRRLVAALNPLWRRLRVLHPAIALPDVHLSARPGLRAGRMLIEIGDGLSLLRVAPGHQSPIDAVAEALAGLSSLRPGTEPASQTLPAPTTAREEEQLFLAVSDAYVKLSAAAGTFSSSRDHAGVRL